MLKSRFTRIVLAVLLAVFLIHQLYSAIYNPITTKTAQYVNETEGVSFTAMIIRNEIPIEKNHSGVMHLKVGDGQRIAKDGTVADVYTSEEASIAVSRIQQLKEQIEDIETIQSYNDLAAVDINLLNGKITDTLGKIMYTSGNGDIKSARAQTDELLTMMNRKEMVIGGTSDFSAQLSALKGELSSLEASLTAPVSSIKASSSGFFVSQIDGYEDVFTVDNLQMYTPEFLDTASPKSVADFNSIGKIVSDYTWYIAAPVTADEALLYKEGDSVKIKTQLKSNPYINVTVAASNLSEDRTRAVIMFSCQEMNAELATMRTGSMTIITGEYEGLRIDGRALRVNDNITGVYIVSGMELKFVKVKVIYQGEDYVICEKSSATDNTSLRLHDKVVVKGRNLYEGKIIN